MILIKRQYKEICQYLVFDIYPLFTLSKNQTLETRHNWLLSNWSRLLN